MKRFVLAMFALVIVAVGLASVASGGDQFLITDTDSYANHAPAANAIALADPCPGGVCPASAHGDSPAACGGGGCSSGGCSRRAARLEARADGEATAMFGGNGPLRRGVRRVGWRLAHPFGGRARCCQ